jgi:hypothetical protein
MRHFPSVRVSRQVFSLCMIQLLAVVATFLKVWAELESSGETQKRTKVSLCLDGMFLRLSLLQRVTWADENIPVIEPAQVVLARLRGRNHGNEVEENATVMS